TSVTLYTKDDVGEKGDGSVAVRQYRLLREAADCVAPVCVLDGRSVKLLVAMYPSAPKYVLVRVSLSSAWLLGFFGLIRRALFGLVRIKKLIQIIDETGRKTYWLVLEQTGKSTQAVPVLPSAIGIAGFLRWLAQENIEYVVLRFYEKLPELYREGGDLDLLLSDAGKQKVETYLKENQHLLTETGEDIRLGLLRVSGEPGDIPAYPPPLARQILERSVSGPAGSRIPAPQDALYALIYHCLYHSRKGHACGIPSTLKEETEKYPENDYFGVIKQKAAALGTEVGATMEEMDNHLAQAGWRPKLDTLAKIADTNDWVHQRFFADAAEHKDALVGLSVFIFREWVLEAGLTEALDDLIRSQGYRILHSKIFTDEEKQTAFENLRGGTWGSDESGNTDGWRPAGALVVVDLKCAKLPPVYAAGFEQYRVRKLKELLRQSLDGGDKSSVHSTDNTRESWEYIEICFPDKLEVIKDEVQAYLKPSRLATITHVLTPRYLKHSLKHSVRNFLIKHFLE
ncbi:hypothetical protein KC722_03425, partial [Candidatus Kaiserbacteria bacterium]|nr:hypothetical protein [Candidatus Kaiserbacteria bacterium]